MIRNLLLTSLLALIVSCTSIRDKPMACASSGMCSVGHSKTWNGDIRPSDKFRDFLSSVTHKKELILICYQRFASFLEEAAIHLHYELLALGFAHHAILGYVEGKEVEKEEGEERIDSCTDLTSIAPSISCIWDSTFIPDWILQGEDRLWHYRWKTMARAIRLGYNVMSVDLDTMFFRGDFYEWIKSPPLKDVNMLCNPEWGPPSMESYGCNGGWIYVQSVRPDGPVAWLWKDVAWNLLRRADDHFEYISKFCVSETGACADARRMKMNCLTFDQSWIYDSLVSAAAGLRLSPNMVETCKEGYTFTDKNGVNTTTTMVLEKMWKLINPTARMVKTKELPESLLRGLGLADLPEFDKTFSYSNLVVPNLAYSPREDLGGRAWVEGKPGNFSSDFERMLKEDCPDCPWWKEERATLDDVRFDTLMASPEKYGAGLAAEPNMVPERFALTPKWLSSGLLMTRRGTILGLNSTRQGYPAMGHIHRWLTMNGWTYYYKLDARKIYGRFNWTLSASLAERYGYSSPYSSGRHGYNASKLLALSPSIDLSRTRSWTEFASIMIGLFQVANISGRVAVIPQISCRAPWLHDVEVTQADIDAMYGYLRPGLVHNIIESVNAMKRNLCHAPEPQSDETEMTLFYPVDGKGELVGGWAKRRRRGRELSSGESSRFSSDSIDPAWRRHRHLATDLNMFSEFCIKMPSLLPPELYHWIKHTDAGRSTSLEPTASNTVFRRSHEPLIQLKPPLSATLKGLVTPSSDVGWSWFDVQAKIPSSEVLREMKAVESKTLVFMDHPILVSLDSKGPRHFIHAIKEAAKANEGCPLILKEKVDVNQTLASFVHGVPCKIDSKDRMIKINPDRLDQAKKGLASEDQT